MRLRQTIPLLAMAGLLVAQGCGGKDAGGGKKGGDVGSRGKGAAVAEGAAPKAGLDGLLEPLLGGWLGRMGKEPKEFGKLTSSCDGWNLLWSGELDRAAEAFERCVSGAGKPKYAVASRLGGARAYLELAGFHRDLFRRTAELIIQYEEERDRRRDKIGPKTPVEVVYQSMARLLLGRDVPEASAALAGLDGKAGRYEALAKAWLGFARALSGDRSGAEAAWSAVPSAGPGCGALLVAYLKARTTGYTGELPEGDGSPYCNKLRWAALVRTGKLDQAAAMLRGLDPKQPDHVHVLAQDGASVDKSGGETKLAFWGPYLYEELARFDLLKAEGMLQGMEGCRCAAYWEGRVMEALGETSRAEAAWRRFLAAAGEAKAAGTKPESPAAKPTHPGAGAVGGEAPGDGPRAAGAEPEADWTWCVVLTRFADLHELELDAKIRLGDRVDASKAPWWAKLSLAARAASKGDRGALEVIGRLPEDPRLLETSLEEGFKPKVTDPGFTALLRGRFFESHVHGLYEQAAEVASALGETRRAVKLLDSIHDNTKADRLSELNRPGYMLAAAVARWHNKDPQGAAVLLNVLWKRYPEVWAVSEFVRRIRAVYALENMGENAPISGQ